MAFDCLPHQVAGSRKVTELLKISKSGRAPLVAFMELAFGRQIAAVAPPTAAAEVAGSAAGTMHSQLATLAPALFGGADQRGESNFLSTPHGFDPALMKSAIEALPAELGEEEALGTALAAAALACRLPWGGERAEAERVAIAEAFEAAVEVAPTHGSSAADIASDAAAAAAAAAATAEMSIACDGLCASNDVRASAVTPLACVSTLLRPPAPLGMQALFAQAAAYNGRGGEAGGAGAASGGAASGGGDGSGGVALSGAEFGALVHMWDTLKLERVTQGKASAGYLPEFIVRLAGLRSSAPTAAALSRRLEQLSSEVHVDINGKALVGIPQLPNHLRGVLISHLHVLGRVRGQRLELHEPEQLRAYLEHECDDLLPKLQAEWYEQGGDKLRAAYAPPGREKKPKPGKPAPKKPAA
jgi:hypothetical protein